MRRGALAARRGAKDRRSARTTSVRARREASPGDSGDGSGVGGDGLTITARRYRDESLATMVLSVAAGPL